MPDPQSVWSIAAGLAGVLWPGVLGAIIAMRWQPAGTPLGDLAITGAISVLLSVVGGPPLTAVFRIDTPVYQAAVSALVAVFGLIVLGEAAKAIREVGLAEFIRNFFGRFGGGGRAK